MARGDLTSAQWAVLEPLLPPDRRRGRPTRNRRQVVNAIRWRARTGAPWRDMPDRYGPWETAYGLFRTWQREGVWASVLEKLRGRTDIITWDVSNPTLTPAHDHQTAAENRPTGSD
ncbi:transposase [Umezawaea sp. NPDC059074]|uniref:transposase n=1 Tax=Umezawaea sp. NPDC059074 TaxID=3346716 RepID=UPI0036B3B38D